MFSSIADWMAGTSAIGTMGLFTSVPNDVSFWRISASGATSSEAASTGLARVSSTIPACAAASASPAHIQMQRFIRSSHFADCACAAITALTAMPMLRISSFVMRKSQREPPFSSQLAPANAPFAPAGGNTAMND